MTSRPRSAIAAATVLAFAGVLLSAPSATADPTNVTASTSADASVAFAGKSYAPTELAKLLQPTNRAELSAMLDAFNLSPGARATFDGFAAQLSDSQLNALLTTGRSETTKAILGQALSVINPADYKCDESPLMAYANSLLPKVGTAEWGQMYGMAAFGVFEVQTYEALLYAEDRPAPFGANNEYGKDLTKAFSQAKKFWDIDSSDMVLGAMDTKLWDHIDGDSPAAKTAYRRAAIGLGVRLGGKVNNPETFTIGSHFLSQFNAILEGKHPDFNVPTLKGGLNDYFTFNAYAFTAKGDPWAESDPVLAKLSDRIIFGEGVLNALKIVGLGADGPKAVLAHEFGHQVQFDKHVVFTAPTEADQPAATRASELQADGLGSYFATHARGLNLNAKRVSQVAATFSNVGDCNFLDAGHHGTPLQRERASLWGSNLASSAQKQGQILPSATVIKEFDKVYPQIIAPDAD